MKKNNKKINSWSASAFQCSSSLDTPKQKETVKTVDSNKWDQEGLQELLNLKHHTLFHEKSDYQDIHLIEATDVRLYLNHQLQFSSLDERFYHEALVHPAFTFTPKHDHVLILGGGDGLALREVLKYKDVKHVNLVDLDPVVLYAAQNIPALTELNHDSFCDSRVTIHCKDALVFLKEDQSRYDVVIIDFPDPTDKSISSLYTNELYLFLKDFLTKDGIFVCQATSPRDTPVVFWSIAKTIESAGFHTISYHTNIPSFGDWGFHIASNRTLIWNHNHVLVPHRTLPANLKKLASFRHSILQQKKFAVVNFLNSPVLQDIFAEEVSDD
ncbi:spermidine synthase [Bacillus songklensis]|uniref:Polyamine aminopropyltransferase n=1 Tax=Bacillus songklensis TaxID=1069116 RepID=A0ABV8B2Q9_9BACI